jgi:hypothetical protein
MTCRFDAGAEQLPSRAWLLDPEETQAASVSAPAKEREPWSGEFYVAFGHSPSRSWPEAVRYGFIGTGGGSWYSNTLKRLYAGDRIWVKAPGLGFVGVGRVTGHPAAATEFTLPGSDGQPRRSSRCCAREPTTSNSQTTLTGRNT